ncbi:MAG: HEAT repeat domain-containing protein [Candidatus Hydrogenedentes bacterium]|nr:HEAT repeat domain-containing protein [Candidatus Hydrogenedentota bacterium]
MNEIAITAIDVTAAPTIWMRLAMAFVHSLWIGASIGAAVFLIFVLLGRKRTHARYATLLLGLLLVASSPIAAYLVNTPRTVSLLEPEGPYRVGRGSVRAGLDQNSVEQTGEGPDRVGRGSVRADTSYTAPNAANEKNRPIAVAITPEQSQSTFSFTREHAARTCVLLYALIACALLLRLAFGVAGGSWLRRRSEPVADGAILSAVARHARAMGLQFAPAIAYCARVAVPTVVGVLRPMVLLPLSAATGMTPEQVEYLVLHELAHIRRYDHIVNLVQRVIEALLFYHPVVWLLSRQIRIEREHCCDDLVVRLGGDAHHYAESLLAAATLARGLATRNAVPTLSATGKASHLRHRIARILGEPAPAVRLRHMGWLLGLLSTSLLIGGAQLFAAKDETTIPESAPKPKETQEIPVITPVATGQEEKHSAEGAIGTIKARVINAEGRPAEVVEMNPWELNEISNTFDNQAGGRDQSASRSGGVETPPLLFEGEDLYGSRLVQDVRGRAEKIEGVRDVRVSRDTRDGGVIVFTLRLKPWIAIGDVSAQLIKLDKDTFGLLKKYYPDAMKNATSEIVDPVQFVISPYTEVDRKQDTPASASPDIASHDNAPDYKAHQPEANPVDSKNNENLSVNEEVASGEQRADEPPPATSFLGIPLSLSPEQAELARQLQDKDWWLRKLAIQQLAETKAPSAWQLIVPLLKDEDKRVRSAAAEVLGNLKEPKSIKHLVAALKEDRETADVAAKALAHFDPEQVMPILQLAAADEDWGVQRGAIKALVFLKHPEVIDVIIGVLGKIPLVDSGKRGLPDHQLPWEVMTSDYSNADLMQAFVALETNSFQQLIARAMADDNWRVRAGLTKVLAIPQFRNNPIGRITAEMSALLNRTEVVQAQVNAMRDAQKDVRAWAAAGLAIGLDSLPDNSDATVSRTTALIAGMRDQNMFIRRICGRPLLRASEKRKWQPSNDEEKIALRIAVGRNSGWEAIGPKAIPALVAAMNLDRTLPFTDVAESPASLNFIASALSQIGGLDVVEPLVTLLDTVGSDTVISICEALGNIGDPRAVEPLIRIAANIQAGSQTSAIRALGKLKEKRAYNVLVSSLQSSSYEVRVAAAGALGEIGDPRAVPILVSVLEKGIDPHTQISAVNSLGDLKDPAAVPVLEETLKNQATETPAREEAARALGKIGGAQASDALVAALRTDPQREVRLAVAEALGEINDPAAIGPLSDALQFDEGSVQTAAATSIVQIGTPDAFDALRGVYVKSAQQSAIGENTAWARIVLALCKIHSPAALDMLYGLLRDDKIYMAKLQLRAALTLAENKDPRAKEFLDKLRGIPETRIDSERALTELQEQPSEAQASDAPATPSPAESALPEAVPGAETNTTAPLLQFRLVLEGADAEGKPRTPAPTKNDPDATMALADDIWLTEADMTDAAVRVDDQTGEPCIAFGIKPEAGEKLYERTSGAKGRKMAIVYKGVVLSAPIINDGISTSGIITGDISLDEIAAAINKAAGVAR